MGFFSSKDLSKEGYLRALVLGVPKIGKTAMVVVTSPGPVAVLNCEDDSALEFAAYKSKRDFPVARITGPNTIFTEIINLKPMVASGEVKTIVVDPFSDWAAKVEEVCLDEVKGDGRRAYPKYNRAIMQVLHQLFALKAHVICISHFIDSGGGQVQPEDGDDPTPRSGEGIFPLLAGQARAKVPAKFNTVAFMEYTREGKRVLLTGPRGIWGPGSRSLPDTYELPADINDGGLQGIAALIQAIKDHREGKPISVGRSVSLIVPKKAPAAAPTKPTPAAVVKPIAKPTAPAKPPPAKVVPLRPAAVAKPPARR